MVEEAARYPSDVQTNARFTLIVMYNREERYDDALRVVGELQRRYPRNRLLWLEAGSTALRAGRPATRASRSKRDSPGWPPIAAAGVRRGGAMGLLPRRRARRVEGDDGRRARARAALGDPSRAWVHGRIHKELGKLADLAGRSPSRRSTSTGRRSSLRRR